MTDERQLENSKYYLGLSLSNVIKMFEKHFVERQRSLFAPISEYSLNSRA